MVVGKNIRSAVYEKNEHKDRHIADKADALKQKCSNVQNSTKCPCIDMFNAITIFTSKRTIPIMGKLFTENP